MLVAAAHCHVPGVNPGYFGVDLFFVLSGFLVSGLLFKEFKKHERISISRFYLRRGLRIYPPFFFFIGVSLISWLLMKKPVEKLTDDYLLSIAAYLGSLPPTK